MSTFHCTFYPANGGEQTTGTFSGKSAREVHDKLRALPEVHPHKLLTVSPV